MLKDILQGEGKDIRWTADLFAKEEGLPEMVTVWVNIENFYYLNLLKDSLWFKEKIICCGVYNICRSEIYSNNSTKARRGEM